MNIGMLWYDDSPLGLKERIEKAAEYYLEKYGHKPNLCLVHPSMLNGEELRVNGVVVRRFPSVRPGHFWIGVDEDPAESKPAKPAKSKPAKPVEPKPTKSVEPKPAKSAKPSRSTEAAKPKPRSAGRKPSAAGRKKAARGRK